MAIDSTIFKSYDVRGIYPSQLNEGAAFAVGRAFVKHMGSNPSTPLRARNVVVGYDARLSSLQLFKALAEGLLAAGAKVTTIGQVLTECLYFAAARYDFDGGIMVTASHNPKEYNGFKMVTRAGGNVKIIPGKDILTAIEDSSYIPQEVILQEKNIWEDYMNHIFSFVEVSKVNPMKVVVDASNGVIGKAITLAKNKLPCNISDLNFTPNGNFPNHSPNPLEEGSADQIREKIKKEGADIGFIFDGDADRVYIITEKGDFIKADITLTLLAKYFLGKNPGAGIAFHVTCSKSVGEFVKKWGGKPIRTKVGFVNIQQGLIDNDGVMGGELSGHYCFKDHFYFDSGMIAFLTLLQIISQDGRKVSEIVKELSLYVKDPEINFEIQDKEEVMEKIKEKYSDGKQDFLDGVTVEYRNWWFNVRPSNTEPLLRLTIEADTQELLEQKKQELTEFLTGV